jgi:hypothetical protein
MVRQRFLIPFIEVRVLAGHPFSRYLVASAPSRRSTKTRQLLYLAAMGMTNLRHSLEKKFAALTGQLEEAHANIARIRREQAKLPELEARVSTLVALIESATMLLKDAHSDWEPEQTPSVRPWTHTLPIPFGSCGRRGMEVLRHASQPMTVRQIAIEVLRQAGNEDVDPDTLKRTLNAIEASLRKHRNTSVTSSGKYPAQWRSIANPGVEFDI